MIKEIKDTIEDKDIIEWLGEYLDTESIDISIKHYGTKKTIIDGMKIINEDKYFSDDNIRKELSEYIGRIISIDEFRAIKEYGICG